MKRHHVNHARPRGFSMVELLVALVITSMLLAGTLSALRTSFNSYKVTTESASSHVVARMVMHRVTAMVRTGSDFGPFPVNPIRTPEITPDPPRLEFVSAVDDDAGTTEVTRIERRDAPAGVIDAGGAPYELWYVRTVLDDADNVVSTDEAPLLTDVQNVRFTLFYDVGPRLRKMTMDLTIRPPAMEAASVAAGLETPSFRFITSVSPRRTD